MAYEQKNFDGLLGMDGFSDTMLKNHFTLYGGYVANTNKSADALSAMAKDARLGTPEYAEMKRRFGWEFDGMRLHELYFGSMKKGGSAKDAAPMLGKKIAEDFGSFENWKKDFRAAGGMRGIGWIVLYFDPAGKRLFNCWINEHDCGHLAGCVPILVMDIFEHAYMTDYQLKKADYISAFIRNIDWKACESRFGNK